MLAHGAGSSHLDWDDLRSSLVSTGYRTLALDLPGHGASFKPSHREAISATSIYRVFSSWLEEQAFEQPPVLIGHSLGGGISLKYVCEHPHSVRGLVLIDPYYSLSQLYPVLRAASRSPRLCEFGMRHATAPMLQLALGLAPGLFNGISQKTRQQMVADQKRTSPHVLYSAATIDELRLKPENADCPVLVIWGGRDLTLNPASFTSLVDSLPRARGVPVPGALHFPHRSHPAAIREAVSAFLEDI